MRDYLISVAGGVKKHVADLSDREFNAILDGAVYWYHTDVSQRAILERLDLELFIRSDFGRRNAA